MIDGVVVNGSWPAVGGVAGDGAALADRPICTTLVMIVGVVCADDLALGRRGSDQGPAGSMKQKWELMPESCNLSARSSSACCCWRSGATNRRPCAGWRLVGAVASFLVTCR